jgi:hypothetical protein
VSHGVAGSRLRRRTPFASVDYAAANCGDTVAGKKCEFVYRDVQSDARATVSAFTELSDADHISCVMGPIQSFETIGDALWSIRKIVSKKSLLSRSI